MKKSGYESQTQYIEVHNKEHQIDAQRLDITLRETSSERADLQRMLRQYMHKVSSYKYKHFISLKISFSINYW